MQTALFRLLCRAGFFFASICNAQAINYAVDSDVIGKTSRYTVREGENLYAIARRYDLGIVELLAANPELDPWMPPAGTKLTLTVSHVLPMGLRQGIVINLAELRLFYFSGTDAVATFPIGIGQQGWPTPLGGTAVVAKRRKPTWIPPDSIRSDGADLPKSVPPGDSNPLGDYALYLGWPRFLIHGTNRPAGVGRRSSHGCIRLYAEDIAQLYAMVPLGTPVTIVDQPYKLGWRDGVLFLEVTPNQEQSDAIANYDKAPRATYPEVYDAIMKMVGDRMIDLEAIEDAIGKHDGIPVAITD